MCIFVIYQLMYMVFFCEPIRKSIFMLIKPSLQIVCYTNIHYMVIPIGKYIHIIHIHVQTILCNR